ncbi:hypothetical protein, partial [Vibrio sp. TRT 2004]|uniref:hypothetical protein n=1 Tax=Vibrio sp. TRT 2004 TaxID=3418506 RepID=UPI003CF10E9D
LASRFSLLASRFSLLASRFSLLASRFSLLASRFGTHIANLNSDIQLTLIFKGFLGAIWRLIF